METGWYGGYELFLNYDQSPHYVSNDSKTIFNGVNGNNLTLPDGFVRGDVMQNFAWKATDFENSLNAYKKDVNIKTDRKSGSVGFSVPVWSVFDFDANYRREEKRGLKSIAGAMGQSGGDRRAIWLPEPVNFSVDEVTASLSYSGEKTQLNLGYFYSNFRNKYNSLAFENPFHTEMIGVQKPDMTTYYINAGDAGGIAADETILTSGPYYYGNLGQISMDPDNDYHRFSLSGGVDLPMSSRITVLGEYGLMRQDNNLLPYTINPEAAIHTPLPRNSARGEIETFHVTANASTRPLEDLSLNLKYRLYKTRNNTPMDTWLKAFNDMSIEQAAENSASALRNLPYDYTQNKVDFGASYDVHHGSFMHTVLNAGYIYDNMDRDYREVKQTEENTFYAGLRSIFASYGMGNAGFSHGLRKNNGYNQSRLFNAYHSPEHVNEELTGAAPDLAWDNHPALRKYDLADRIRDKFSGAITLTPDEMIALGLYYTYANDTYSNAVFGLEGSRNNSYTLDFTFTPTPPFTLFGYYTWENMNADQAGRAFRGSAKAAESADPNRDWRANHDDSVDTFGLGGNYRLLDDKLNLRADCSYSDASSDISFTAGNSLKNEPLPALTSTLSILALTGDYKLTPNWSVGLGYRYELYRSDNWGTDGVDPASKTLGDVITMTASIPDYDAHVGSMFITYYFGGK